MLSETHRLCLVACLLHEPARVGGTCINKRTKVKWRRKKKRGTSHARRRVDKAITVSELSGFEQITYTHENNGGCCSTLDQ